MYSSSLSINSLGNLTISDCDLQDLATQYGTPLNILNEKTIRYNCREFNHALECNYTDYQVMYAGKAMLNRAICSLIYQEGLGLDVVTGGELYIAQKAGFPADRIVFHGNNKSESELLMALKYGVKTIAVDNFSELFLLQSLAKQLNKTVNLYLRITPGINAETHDYIKTGLEDSKFGFNIQGEELWDAVKFADDVPQLNLTGLHCHIGSQIIDSTFFQLAAEALMNLIGRLKSDYAIDISELDLGGGFGIEYMGTERIDSKEQMINEITNTVKNLANKHNLDLPKLIIEPGRSIIGDAGTMLYTIGAIKDIPGVRKYISVDGGMSDNIRPALYSAEYNGVIANKANQVKMETVTVAGKTCESGDILISNLHTPVVKRGDLLAMPSCGAYTYSMASNYNQLPRPAVVLVKDGQADLIMKRESYENLLINDVVPDRLTNGKNQEWGKVYELY